MILSLSSLNSRDTCTSIITERKRLPVVTFNYKVSSDFYFTFVQWSRFQWFLENTSPDCVISASCLFIVIMRGEDICLIIFFFLPKPKPHLNFLKKSNRPTLRDNILTDIIRRWSRSKTAVIFYINHPHHHLHLLFNGAPKNLQPLQMIQKISP